MSAADSGSGQWYWCLKHAAVEPAAGCANSQRMGPYASAAEARNWRSRVEARNDSWDAQDENEPD